MCTRCANAAGQGGETVPWFDQPGGGTQYMTAVPVARLIDDGSLAEMAGK